MDEAGIDQAAEAFFQNDLWYPRPAKTEERDIALWKHFTQSFLYASRMINGGDRLGQMMIDALEALGEQRAKRAEELRKENYKTCKLGMPYSLSSFPLIIDREPIRARDIVESMKALLVEHGRSEDSIRFIAGVFIVVAETDEQAQAKFDDLLRYANLEGTAALFGGWTGTDLSPFSDDEDFSFKGPPAIQSMISAWTATVPGTEGLKWTERRVLQELAISGAHPRAVGSAKTVADILQKWVDEAHVDGFNISYATTPGTFDDLIKYLWPELRRRGVLQEHYAGKTMRENYLQDGKGPYVRTGHPATKYKRRTDNK